MRKVVPVNLGERSYDIVIAPDLMHQCHEILQPIIRGRRLAVVTDPYLDENCLHRFAAMFDALSPGWKTFVVPGGESAKSFSGIEDLLNAMLEAGIDRDCVLLAFGGGVVGDVGGFAAALLMRGIDLVQIPTTLMSQVDSAVGGKNAINTPLGKNLIGTFLQPQVVLNDVTLLDSLPDEELRAGYGEIVKYGMLRGETQFAWLESNVKKIMARDKTALVDVIAMGVETKAMIVTEDEFDKGKRALVNLGHTFAHAFETQSGFGEFQHGYSVGVGLICAAELSARLGHCDASVPERVTRHLRDAGLPLALTSLSGDAQWNADAIYRSMQHDKKTVGGNINFVLLREFGDVFVANSIPEQTVLDTLYAVGAV